MIIKSINKIIDYICLHEINFGINVHDNENTFDIS